MSAKTITKKDISHKQIALTVIFATIVSVILILTSIRVLDQNTLKAICENRCIIKAFEDRYVDRQIAINQRFCILEESFKEVQKDLADIKKSFKDGVMK